ncbi:unnamed protein product [Owenia fusiformis]|uniref:Uncharacterized protein n=1 Tax=Owenia fusiformis TaxID=6347 RepID=A0A8J1UEP3_OWEFU|nr:unnamed protein product [Owenia fusiformis]
MWKNNQFMELLIRIKTMRTRSHVTSWGCLVLVCLFLFICWINMVIKPHTGQIIKASIDVDIGCWNKDFRKIIGKKFFRCRKGVTPWTRDDVIKELEVFRDVYDKRPEQNVFGTEIMQQFTLWMIIRQLNPLYIIESGVNFGLGTWMLRQAAPLARLIMIDPRETDRLRYKDLMYNSVYLHGISHFKDFSQVNWTNYINNREKTLVFFDDHQSHYKRLKQAKDLGFKHLVFDDNGHPTKGDVYSINHACDAGRCITDRIAPQSKHTIVKDNFGTAEEAITADDALEMAQYIHDSIEIYYQFPPLWHIFDTTRVQYLLPHKISYKINPIPLMNLKQAKLYQKNFTQKLNIDDLTSYTNMCYVKLK